MHGRFALFFTRTVVDKAANWDSRAIFQPPFRLGVVDSNWNSPQTINDCDVCVCVCVRAYCLCKSLSPGKVGKGLLVKS